MENSLEERKWVEMNKEELIKKALLYKRIIDWRVDKVTLEDGTILEVECLYSDCCAWGGGRWDKVKLDAVITDIELTDVENPENDDTHITTGVIKIYHNRNIIAQNEMYTDAGNGGYYGSVTGLVVKLPDKSKLTGFVIEA